MEREINIGFVGIGVVGYALSEAFKQKGFSIIRYDKYKSGYQEFDKLKACDYIFLCLPTLTIDNKQDLSAFYEFLPLIKDYEGIIINKSTVLPGTTDKLREEFKLNIIHSPEFLTEKNALCDALYPHKIVFGIPHTANFEQDLFNICYAFSCPIFFTNIITSELIKYACNCELAMQVSFANELYDISKSIGASYDDIKTAMLSDNRIGRFKTVTEERGYGGMCFPKDTEAFVSLFDSDMIKATIKVNERVRK